MNSQRRTSWQTTVGLAVILAIPMSLIWFAVFQFALGPPASPQAGNNAAPSTPEEAAMSVAERYRRDMQAQLEALANEVSSDGESSGAIVIEPPPGLHRGVIVAPNDERLDGGVESFSLSDDGSVVAFDSDATSLVPNDTNRSNDVYLRRGGGAIQRISVSSEGIEGNADSWAPSISGDGRFVVFLSRATNFDATVRGSGDNVYLHDTQTEVTELVSRRAAGADGDYDCANALISANGQVISFTCYRRGMLVDSADNYTATFFVDRDTRDSTHCQGEITSMSRDGQVAVFASRDSVFVPSDTNRETDIFVLNRKTATTIRASVSSAGDEANDESSYPVISGDGRYVVFRSSANNLVPDDTNNSNDVFLRDLEQGVTERISVSAASLQGNDDSYNANLSDDGRYVGFYTEAYNILPVSIDSGTQLVIRDRQRNMLFMAAINASGQMADGSCDHLAISRDGTAIAFKTRADNLFGEETRHEQIAIANSLELIKASTMRIR